MAIASVVCAVSSASAANATFQIESPQTHNPFQSPTFALSPPYTEFKNVKPGQVLKFPMYVQNRLNYPVDVTLEVQDAEGSENPENLIDLVKSSRYGAGSWVKLEKTKFHLESGDKATQEVTVSVPPDVGGGSWYAAITASSEVATEKGGAQVGKVAGLNSIILVNMAGGARVGGKIVSVDAPLYATHGSVKWVPIDVVWQNTGNVTDAVKGQIYVRSIIGNKVFSKNIGPNLVLRNGSRGFDAQWEELPWIGLFRPTVTLTGRDGKTQTKTEAWIIVMPPWYYIVALVVAIMLPIGRWWWKRRQWNKLYLEMYGDDDESWDDDEFEDY